MSALIQLAALFLSVLLHGVIIVFLLFGWHQKPPELQINRPQVVKATLVELEAKAPPQVQEQPKPDVAAQQEREAELARQEAQKEQERRAAEEAEKKRVADEKEKAEEQQRLEEEQRKQEEQRIAEEKRLQEEQARIDEFNEALAAEEGYQAELASQEVVGSVGAMIRQQVVQQWSPPPSSRKDMVAILKVTMVPTGRLVQVDVIESSGNAAFDRSVVQAVQKAQPFDMVKTLDSVVFEKNFREFRFLFSPQDLRL